MSPELIGLIGIIALFICLAFRMWIGAAMALVGFLGLVALRGLTQALAVMGNIPFSTANNYNLTVIPMFVLMGMVIGTTDIGGGLYRTANKWIGHHRGGLASATIVASGLLGAITGSHMAGTIIMSKIALPEMRKHKYDDSLATASIAAGAPLSIIIPPSVPMIMYGLLTEEPIGELFIGGIIPGVILMVIYVITISLITKRNPDLGPAGEKFSLQEKIMGLVEMIPMILLFVLVLGGIYGGFFTTTESGAVGALGAIVIATLARQMTWEKLRICLVQTVKLVGSILILLIGTYIFISFITLSKIPFLLAGLITGANVPVAAIIVLMAVLYIILGMFLPDMAMISLTVPILFPIITQLGLDPLWFGMFVVFMTALGSITPPVGMVVFLLAGLSKVEVVKIFRGVIPFIIAMVLVIVLISVFPDLVTILPSMMKH